MSQTAGSHENLPDLPQRVQSLLPAGIAGTSVLIAVSGGPDSVCLLRVLHELHAIVPFSVTAAHVNHGWRGAESDADAGFVRRLCDSLGVPLVVDKAVSRTTPGVFETPGVLPGGERNEQAARKLRYDFLQRLAVEKRCRFVAVGHTADDQVETVLHHILRGTGLAGLCGMSFERPLHAEDGSGESPSPIRLIRPLLSIRRADVLSYLAALGQTCCMDSTNAETRFTRNRLRHVLLPMLRDRFNPLVDDALLRLAEQAGEAARVIRNLAEQLLDDALLELAPSVCRLRRDPFRVADPEVVRGAMVQLWKRLGWPRRRMTSADWRRAAELVATDGALTLPGGIDARSAGGLLLLRRL